MMTSLQTNAMIVNIAKNDKSDSKQKSIQTSYILDSMDLMVLLQPLMDMTYGMMLKLHKALILCVLLAR